MGQDRNCRAALRDRAGRPLAGLWENWKSPEGEWMRSFAIITTTPNELCAELHNRMPVVLKPDAWPLWLGEEPAGVDFAARGAAGHSVPPRSAGVRGARFPYSTRINGPAGRPADCVGKSCK